MPSQCCAGIGCSWQSAGFSGLERSCKPNCQQGKLGKHCFLSDQDNLTHISQITCVLGFVHSCFSWRRTSCHPALSALAQGALSCSATCSAFRRADKLEKIADSLLLTCVPALFPHTCYALRASHGEAASASRSVGSCSWCLSPFLAYLHRFSVPVRLMQTSQGWFNFL